MTPLRRPPLLARASRALWSAVLLFVLLGLGLGARYLQDRTMVAGVAHTVDGNRRLPPTQRFAEYVRFAHEQVRKNRKPEDVQPGLMRMYYRFNPTHPGPADVLRHGTDYRGGCGSHVRVVVAMLHAAGIDARPLIILGPQGQNIHTVVQARIDGRWVVADALYGIVFHTADGRLATVEDLVREPQNFVRQVRGVRGYDMLNYNYDDVTAFNWNKIPVILPAARKLLVLALGEARVREWQRPIVWMWPAAFYASLCFAIAGFCALLALAGGAARRRFRPRA
ncbi:MAG: transglutaminase domain-containing protein [Candidatus Eisenbacteria bacterium]|nr:transglutaminase domain-containing protein [Candidatus Eisenbacteria bacterium]